MNRYRNAPGLRGPTKATASTLCQKCLKRDIYECKATAQERPYTSRPSRTQQLQNPKLMPKLTTEVPNDLVRSKGVADELLAKREEERARKRDLDEGTIADDRDQMSKRTRSNSSASVSSVSTISTNRSRSASPTRHRSNDEKNDRHRDHSLSPPNARAGKRRYSDSSSDYSASSYSSLERPRSRSREWTHDRNTRRRRRESSPEERGRPKHSTREGSWRDRSRSRSMDKGRIAKERRSMTPEAVRGPGYPGSGRRPSYRTSRSPSDQPYQRSDYSYVERARRDRGNVSAQPRKERSLSPYSKRLALTQAMNMGR